MFKTAIVSVAALAVGAHSAGFWDEKDVKKSFISRVTLLKRNVIWKQVLLPWKI